MLSETSALRARAACIAASLPLACPPVLAGFTSVSQHDPQTIELRYAQFDPLSIVPAVPRELRSAEPGAYIVQLNDRATDESRDAITNAGGQIGRFLPHNAYIVRMDAAIADRVRALGHVRWVGPFHPAYKLDEPLLQAITIGAGYSSPARYSIQMLGRGLSDQRAVAEAITELGGEVHGFEPLGYRIEATLSLDQLAAVAHRSEVLFIDAKGAPETDMDVARLFSGGDQMHALGFTGHDVRGEVLDGGLRTSHADFQAKPPIIHTVNGPITAHGTAVYGIVFGDGYVDARHKGMLPDGQGIFASYTELGFLDEGPGRYEHTAELVDPDGPYRAVFQTNSWGDPRTTDYTTISAQMDDIAFFNDILITQSQSNSGDRDSRPQAWAKNVISVGGINHESTLTRGDDYHWAASTGPAADGRIKPDLSHFYDAIDTTSSAGPMEYAPFNGTSAATPIVAGHFGILYQLWGIGVFMNDRDVLRDVFDNRPSATTARAMIINTATPWPIGDEISRDEQGWGAPDVSSLYDAGDTLFVLDQSWTLLRAGDRAEFLVGITPQGGPLRITMAYLDPAGNPASTIHRINDLDVRVTAPDGTIYHGNVGLHDGLFSQPSGRRNQVDTIENVFIKQAAPGIWTVEVLAQELNEDADLSTPGIDAHFSLVIQGGPVVSICEADFDKDGRLTIFDFVGYQAAFGDGDLRADFDRDGVLTMFDFILFQSRFVVGCD